MILGLAYINVTLLLYSIMTVYGLCFFGSVIIILCVLCMYFVDFVADIGQSRRNDDFLAFHLICLPLSRLYILETPQ